MLAVRPHYAVQTTSLLASIAANVVVGLSSERAGGGGTNVNGCLEHSDSGEVSEESRVVQPTSLKNHCSAELRASLFYV